MRESAIRASSAAGGGMRTRRAQLTGVIERVIPAVGLVAGAIFVASQLNHGWVPLDEGTLAQSAQRVLAGELPHRDFAELYTGGLSFLNAGVLRLTDGNLFWLRVPMFAVFLVYLPCVYLIARRFASPVVATLAALFSVAWGPPVYPAAMPSWYTLYLAVIGAYFLLKHHETQSSRWLFWAGLVGGLSLCVKVTGVWYVLAVAVYLVYRSQGEASSEAEPGRPNGRRIAGVVHVAVPAASALVVAGVLAEKLGSAELVSLLLPVLAICGLAIWAVLRAGARGNLGASTILAAPFLAGLVLPAVVFAVPYVATGSLGDLYTGLFVTPRGRLGGAGSYSTPDPVALVFALPVLLALVAGYRRTRAARVVDVAASAAVGALVLAAATVGGYAVMWYTTTALLPVGVFVGVALLARPSEPGLRTGRMPVFGLLALTAFVALVQFPFAAPVYFCFVAPLALLAWLAMFRWTALSTSSRRIFPSALLVAVVAFGFVVNHGVLYRDGIGLRGNPQDVILDPGKAWIRVSPADRSAYRETTRLLREHARGSYVFAGPDTPEIYALAGFRNPTRSLFDYLDPSNSARGENLLRTLRSRGITAIVINLHPVFSNRLDRRTVARLRRLYPHHERVRAFDVRWRA